MCNCLSACCALESETGTNASAQVLTQKNWEKWSFTLMLKVVEHLATGILQSSTLANEPPIPMKAPTMQVSSEQRQALFSS